MNAAPHFSSVRIFFGLSNRTAIGPPGILDCPLITTRLKCGKKWKRSIDFWEFTAILGTRWWGICLPMIGEEGNKIA